MKSIWSGTVSFGLINLPVNLYSGSKIRRLDFEYLRKGDRCPVGYQYVCKNTGEKVDYENIVRGYEYKKGEYVILEGGDFKRANVRKTNSIEIINFVNEEEIDSKFFQKPYYLEPVKNGEKIYVLLREALKKSNKVGIAKYVLRTVESLGVLKAEGDYLWLNQIRYKSQINFPSEKESISNVSLKEQEIDLAVKLINQLSSKFDPDGYKDTYKKDLLEIINKKIKGEEVRLREEKLEPTEVSELLVRLQESLQRVNQSRGV